MVVNGAVSGFALVLRMMTGPGDRVVVDHPTYPLAIAAIQGAQCRPVGVSLPETGWDTHGFAATLAQTAPRLAYLMPDFHNPTGRCMDIPTRQAITEIAAQTRTTLVVDETMVDLWFDSPPPPPLASFNPQATVITLGSAGKSFWGGLRLGWIRASSRTIATLAQTRDTLDLGSPMLEQLATLWLINNSETFCLLAGRCWRNGETNAARCCASTSLNGHSMKRKAGFPTGLNCRGCWQHSLLHAQRYWESTWGPARGLVYRVRLIGIYVCPFHSIRLSLNRHY